MQPKLRDLIENLAWFDRRRVVDPPITMLRVAWEARFKAQGNLFIRSGMPFLRSLKESDKTDNAITRALGALSGFKFPAADNALTSGTKIVFSAGAEQASRDIGAGFTLSGHEAALEYLKLHGAEKLAADVDATTRNKVRGVLVQSFEDSWTYNKTVKEIRALYDGFTAASPQGHIRNRAELIAVNELGNAYSQGSLYVGTTLAAGGLPIEKFWALAANPCPLCETNAAEGWIDVNEVFPSGDDCPCAHPACRCSLVTRAKQI